MSRFTDFFRGAVDKAKGLSQKFCTPPPGTKLRPYEATVKLSMMAVNKKVVEEALKKMSGQLPEWAPALLGMLGVADKAKIIAIETDLETVKGKKSG